MEARNALLTLFFVFCTPYLWSEALPLMLSLLPLAPLLDLLPAPLASRMWLLTGLEGGLYSVLICAPLGGAFGWLCRCNIGARGLLFAVLAGLHLAMIVSLQQLPGTPFNLAYLGIEIGAFVFSLWAWSWFGFTLRWRRQQHRRLHT